MAQDQRLAAIALQVQRFEGGERQRYFADDDQRSLDDLVREQRYQGAANTDSNLADNIMRKGKRFRSAGITDCHTRLVHKLFVPSSEQALI